MVTRPRRSLVSSYNFHPRNIIATGVAWGTPHLQITFCFRLLSYTSCPNTKLSQVPLTEALCTALSAPPPASETTPTQPHPQTANDLATLHQHLPVGRAIVSGFRPIELKQHLVEQTPVELLCSLYSKANRTYKRVCVRIVSLCFVLLMPTLDSESTIRN
jgi:hypothetical protein